MCLSRRFQNLIVDSPHAGAKSLRCVDLMGQLFCNTATPQSIIGDESEPAVLQDSTSRSPAADSCNWKNEPTPAAATAAALKMERICLSNPIFRFATFPPYEADGIPLYCFPLSDRKVVIVQHTRRALLYDADQSCVVPMPNLNKWKIRPISLFVPSAHANAHPNIGGSLSVMDKGGSLYAGVERGSPSDQFEAFVCSKPTVTSEALWHCRFLPPPPFVYDNSSKYPQIISYGVVGSNICISTKCNGTYCLDTANNTWEVSKWRLPFYGKVEYVPELKLWFGLSDNTTHLVAADLSAMDSQPQLVGEWEVFDPPEGWLEHRDSLLVNLGLGRFCIVKFFQTMSMDGEDIIDKIVVFIGVEVMPVVHDGNCSGSGSDNGKVKLRMKRHKSGFHLSNGTTVEAVF